MYTTMHFSCMVVFCFSAGGGDVVEERSFRGWLILPQNAELALQPFYAHALPCASAHL